MQTESTSSYKQETDINLIEQRSGDTLQAARIPSTAIRSYCKTGICPLQIHIFLRGWLENARFADRVPGFPWNLHEDSINALSQVTPGMIAGESTLVIVIIANSYAHRSP